MSDWIDALAIIAGSIVALVAIIATLIVTGFLTFHDLQWAYDPYKGLFYVLFAFALAIGLIMVAIKIVEKFW